MDVREYIDRNAPGFFGALREWLAIPSISADPSRHGDVRRSAEWLAGQASEADALGRFHTRRDAHLLAGFEECTSLARDLSQLADQGAAP